MKNALPRSSEHADHTQKRILQAAVRQFSQYGLAGARIDAIAQAAKVNKALLYYYFKNKKGLYAAALQMVSGRVMESAMAALASGSSAGESVLRCVLNHFDRILTQREFQSLMQQEMVRYRRGESESFQLLVGSLFAPLLDRIHKAVREGIRTGELHEMDWLQIVYAALGANVFYFLSAPMMRLALPFEPLAPAAVESRRKAALEFLGCALFRDRSHGARLAKRVLADTAMPAFKQHFVKGRFS